MDCFSSMDNARRVKLWRVIAAFSIIPIEECRTVTHTQDRLADNQVCTKYEAV